MDFHGGGDGGVSGSAARAYAIVRKGCGMTSVLPVNQSGGAALSNQLMTTPGLVISGGNY